MRFDTETALETLKGVKGFIAAAIGHYGSGTVVGMAGGDELDLEVAVAMNSDVIKAKIAATDVLELDGGIDDILVSLSEQYHLIRPLSGNTGVFFYLALRRRDANLAMARRALEEVERGFEVT